MTLEFRPKGTGSFDLYDLDGKEGRYDETGRIGSINWSEDDAGELEPDSAPLRQYWVIDMWSNSGSGKTWFADAAESQEQAIEWAREFYEELLADRREHGRRGSARVLPTPMGGQRHWR